MLSIAEEGLFHLFLILPASGYLRQICEKFGLLKAENTDLFHKKALQSTNKYSFQVSDIS